jgi:proteasome lid subunit RPN8/RPN11
VSYRDAFEISHGELRRLRAYAEDQGLSVVALFHSHPSGDSRLSAGDRDALRYSEWPWVIVTREARRPVICLRGYAPPSARRIPLRVDRSASRS